MRELRQRLEPWVFLALGLALAPLFAWVPVLRYMAGFLAMLVHEMGHAGLAWLCGSPTAPGLADGGHPALQGEPWLPLTVGIFVMLVATASAFLAGRQRVLALALVVAGYPALVLTPARDLVHVLAGHGAEIVAATLCLWMALHGRRTESAVERVLHGTVGGLLLGQNASACWALVRLPATTEHDSSELRALAADALRAAELLGWPPRAIALTMLFTGLLALPAAVCLWRAARTRTAEPSAGCAVLR